MNNEKKISTKMVVEAGIMLALATVLSFVKMFKMPQGGSVTLASMFPILLFALRHGLGKGLTIGVLYGIIQFIIEPFMVSPVQFLLDYPLAFGALGLAGLYSDKIKENKKITTVLTGCFLGMFGRMICHVIAGVVYFKEYAGDQNPLLYSISYNGTYMLVELIITSIIIYLTWDKINQVAKSM